MAREKPLPRVDGKGIIDMHVHVGPEFIRRRYSPASPHFMCSPRNANGPVIGPGKPIVMVSARAGTLNNIAKIRATPDRLIMLDISFPPKNIIIDEVNTTVG